MSNKQYAKGNVNNDLKMLSFDADQMVQKFQSQVETYLDNNPTDLFNKCLFLSRDCEQIYIGNNLDNTAFEHSQYVLGGKTSSVKRNERTNAEFATHIIKLYAKYLQNKVKKQSQMNNKDLFAMIDKNVNEPLFSAQAYIDWLVSHLEDFNDNDYRINTSFIYNIGGNRDYTEYFLERLSAKLPHYKKLDSAVLNQILDLILYRYQYTSGQCFVTPNLTQLVRQLYTIVNHKSMLDKINNNKYLKYIDLFILFRSCEIKDIKLPIISTIFLSSKNADYYNIDYQIENNDALQEFIKALYEYPRYISQVLHIIIKHNVTINFANHQQILDSQIYAMKNKFNYVEIMQKILDVLVVLSRKKDKNDNLHVAQNVDKNSLLKTLKMYPTSAKQIIQQFHNQMEEYLNNNDITEAFSGRISVSKNHDQLYVNDYSLRLQFNKVYITKISRNKRTNKEFADCILTTYAKCLQAKKKEQLERDINDLFSKGWGVRATDALFSPQAYIDWFVDNLEVWDDTTNVDKDFIFSYLGIDYVDYFVKKLIEKIPTCKQINSGVINQIMKIVLMKYANPKRHSMFYPPVTTLSMQLYNIVNYPSSKAVTDIRYINYKNLLNLFKLSKMDNIQLPLVATLSLNYHANSHVEYHIKDLSSLKLFIDRICSRKPYLARRILAIIAKHKVDFEFDGYQNFLNTQINTIKNDFYYITSMQQVPKVLAILSTL